LGIPFLSESPYSPLTESSPLIEWPHEDPLVKADFYHLLTFFLIQYIFPISEPRLEKVELRTLVIHTFDHWKKAAARSKKLAFRVKRFKSRFPPFSLTHGNNY
jgi:hypothetical protein